MYSWRAVGEKGEAGAEADGTAEDWKAATPAGAARAEAATAPRARAVWSFIGVAGAGRWEVFAEKLWVGGGARGRGGDGVPESEERKVVPTNSSFLVLNVGR